MKHKLMLVSGVVAAAGLVLGLSTTAMAATHGSVPVPVSHKVSKPVKAPHVSVPAAKADKVRISVPVPVAPGDDTSRNAG